MKAICIIPARGGSKRIPRKNLRPFHGKPIIVYSIECARASCLFERIAVSTDDPDIAGIARQEGVTIYQRPPELAGDTIGTQDVMRYHVMDDVHFGSYFDYYCCLYPTAPMLSPRTLRDALALLEQDRRTSYVVPCATWLRDPGQFYFGGAWAFNGNVPLLGPSTKLLPIDPATECDINTEEDWLRAEQMYAERDVEAFAKARL